jgi:hypothetical protein
VLLNTAGQPLPALPLLAYPLDRNQQPLAITVPDAKGMMVTWNPNASCDAAGRFVLEMPRVTRIGKDSITSLAIGLAIDRGVQMVTATVLEIVYADPEKKSEYGFVRVDKDASLIKKSDGSLLTVDLTTEASEVDLGTLATQIIKAP